jgi:hypothetical protein
MVGSIPYNDRKGCPSGFHKRSSYRSRSGHRVPPRCVKSQTVYAETRKNFQKRMVGRQTARIHAMGKSVTRRKECPPGKIERKGYVRKFGADILKRGYTVKKVSGKPYRIHPTKEAVYVKPSCIKKLGLPTQPGPGERFGILRKGELKKHGYIYDSSQESRHNALKKAMKEFGALGVFRKLDAVAKLSKRRVPRAAQVFKADRDWIRNNYKLEAPK